MHQRLTLVGYRGSGNTTVGRLVAQALGWAFVDVDAEIERRAGQSIASLFTTQGEAAFRDLESLVLAEVLASGRNEVVSTGGGCILREENRAWLRSHGGVIAYLEAPAAVLQQRLRQDQPTRPSLTGTSAIDEVPRVLAEREAIYRRIASAIVPADRQAVTIAQDLIRLVENWSNGRKHTMA